MGEENKPKSKKKKVLVLVLVVLLLVVIAILGIIIYNLLHKEQEEERGTVGNLIADEEIPEKPTFTTDMNMMWTFPSGERTSTDAIIGNSSENEHDVYFEIYLDDEEQTLLYSSPILPVGERLKQLKLDKALPDGQYGAICTFHLLDNEDKNKELSRISFNVTLVFI